MQPGKIMQEGGEEHFANPVGHRNGKKLKAILKATRKNQKGLQGGFNRQFVGKGGKEGTRRKRFRIPDLSGEGGARTNLERSKTRGRRRDRAKGGVGEDRKRIPAEEKTWLKFPNQRKKMEGGWN